MVCKLGLRIIAERFRVERKLKMENMWQKSCISWGMMMRMMRFNKDKNKSWNYSEHPFLMGLQKLRHKFCNWTNPPPLSLSLLCKHERNCSTSFPHQQNLTQEEFMPSTWGVWGCRYCLEIVVKYFFLLLDSVQKVTLNQNLIVYTYT